MIKLDATMKKCIRRVGGLYRQLIAHFLFWFGVGQYNKIIAVYVYVLYIKYSIVQPEQYKTTISKVHHHL